MAGSLARHAPAPLPPDRLTVIRPPDRWQGPERGGRDYRRGNVGKEMRPHMKEKRTGNKALRKEQKGWMECSGRMDGMENGVRARVRNGGKAKPDRPLEAIACRLGRSC
jgi:hypothetical protein